jgi:uncharacterized protein YPO0396
MTSSGATEPESAHDAAQTGYRLHRLEVFNWGTFDKKVWVLHVDGRNALLTGDIGSGKSTLVDAITTLLVPANRVAYNKAAGADSRERTLRSYVQGYYKSERNESSGTAKPVSLRDHNSYSVILGVFHNAGYNQWITLAQVFWLKDAQSQPARFFVGAEQAFSIAEDFSNFGSDINQLRKRLRKKNNVEVFDTFPPYGAWFRRRLGIANEQAMDLFHQTVSMKSVGNLTDFVRHHMLEPFDVAPRIAALISHFEDLNRAHEAVLKAKKQVDMLTPLAADCDKHDELARSRENLRLCREALKSYFAIEKLALLDKRLAGLNADLDQQNRQIQQQEVHRDELLGRQADIKRAVAENGGDRLERLAQEIRRLEVERDARLRKAQRYEELIKQLGIVPTDDESGFHNSRASFAVLRDEAVVREVATQNEHTERSVAFRLGKQEHDSISAEIKSLKGRRSNIPSEHIAIRAAICEALNVNSADMPFVGELLQVRDADIEWEGAAERLLRNFGLSLLVPDKHYAQVAAWVDHTRLRGRLVYFRVRQGSQSPLPTLHPDSLVKKLSIKADSSYYSWMEREVAHRFNAACCETHEQFHREARAVTRAGQIKTAGERHEKDDRHPIDERSRYVLGWNNDAKIAALEKRAQQLAKQVIELHARINGLQREQGHIKSRLDALSKLDEYVDFREIDWHVPAAEISSLQDEKCRLESASDVLRQLTSDLATLTAKLAEFDSDLEKSKEERSKTKQRTEAATDLHSDVKTLIEQQDVNTHSAQLEPLSVMRFEALGEHQLTVESCDNRERDMRDWLQTKIDAQDQALKRVREKIVDAMRSYKNAYPLDTQDVDVAVEAADEYRKMLEKLRADDLPRFEQRFKDLLNENTIREVANFQSQLARERETIHEKIDRINQALKKIDYNPSRYIRLEAQPTTDVEVRDFQLELRACTEGALTGSGDSQYSEAKFLQVKQIIERLRGRDGQTELDRRWTVKTTDVRNWFVFGASERWQEDDKEHEHYSDSGGKSGGQKEKLAYTILAASLVYQFGIEFGEERTKSFRFVVIDEAFGRGSDESAQYGLELFAQLNLQLLIVTPLQKIHIIEPFVASVGFVHNEGGGNSRVRNLSIEEYRAEKARLAG